MRVSSALCFSVLLAGLTGCAPDAATYYRDIEPIVDAKCVSCHTEGDIAPFPLQTYEQVHEARAAIDRAVRAGTMPPWPAADGCREYSNDRSFEEGQEEALLAWLADDLPEGDVADSVEAPIRGEFEYDLELSLLEPYTPRVEPDDQRCFLIPWTEPEPVFVTGFEVVPDERAIVHHVIGYYAEADDLARYRQLDDADPGPGYTCYGGPGTNTADWFGAWAPGGAANYMPQGTGIEIAPGSVIILQMHYNTTSAAPVPDQSSIRVRLADEVDRPAITMPYTEFDWVTGSSPMTIPAGEADVMHSMYWNPHNYLTGYYGETLGIEVGDALSLHSAALHMHDLGTAGRLTIDHGSSETCLVEIDDWDFNWQGRYAFVEEAELAADDQLYLECHWDNTAENQPLRDGERRDPLDVAWGDGTSDEMCLGVAYITARP